MRTLARRIQALEVEFYQLDNERGRLVQQAAPELLNVQGVGPFADATLPMAAGDNPERIRGEAAFAKMCAAGSQACLVRTHRLCSAPLPCRPSLSAEESSRSSSMPWVDLPWSPRGRLTSWELPKWSVGVEGKCLRRIRKGDYHTNHAAKPGTPSRCHEHRMNRPHRDQVRRRQRRR